MEFTPDWLNDPDVRALGARVQIVADDDGRTTETPVEVEPNDGRVLPDGIDVGALTPPDQLRHQRQRLASKFSTLAAPVVGPFPAVELIERVETFDQLPNVRILMDRVRGASAEQKPRHSHDRRQIRDPGSRSPALPPATGE